jgi:hypothetical protein
MTEDNPFATLTTDVHHLQSDMTEVKGDVRSLRSMIEALRSDLLTFKVEMAREFGSVAKEFGSVRASIERQSCGCWLRGWERFCRYGEQHWHWPDFCGPRCRLANVYRISYATALLRIVRTRQIRTIVPAMADNTNRAPLAR